jgi:disulfide bond formation protein DsbB
MHAHALELVFGFSGCPLCWYARCPSPGCHVSQIYSISLQILNRASTVTFDQSVDWRSFKKYVHMNIMAGVPGVKG